MNDQWTSRHRPRPRFLVLTGIVLVAALSRLLPHPPNFTPIGAIALFGGAHFVDRRAAFLVPLLAMAVSDLLLEVLAGTGLHLLLPVVYGCFVLTSWLGTRLPARRSIVGVLGAATAAAALFYIVTNLGVWALGGYPKTAAGLVECYVAALPFFGNTLLGHLVYSAALFGGFAYAEERFPVLAVERTAPM